MIDETMGREGVVSLLEKTKPIVDENKRIRSEREANGDFFNIFSILDVERYEVWTHSAFLAELLNPKGSHGKKDEFLKLFVEAMPLSTDEVALDTENAEVRTESSSEEGRIDILIDFPGSKYKVIIENKIYAGDQEKQLERYKRYAEKNSGSFTLLYLTLDGHEPSKWSTGEKRGESYWKCVSYAADIKNWLVTCADISSETVKATIMQYVGLINKLTGQKMEDEMSEPLTNLMMDNFEETMAIIDNQEAFNSEVHKKFMTQMKDLAEELNCDFDSDVEYLGIWGKKNWKYIWFIPRDYPKCGFGVGRDYGVRWYFDKENSSESEKKKLVCFDLENKWYPYGYKMFKYGEWNSDTVRAILNGEMKEYMREFIKVIMDDPNFPK